MDQDRVNACIQAAFYTGQELAADAQIVENQLSQPIVSSSPILIASESSESQGFVKQIRV